MWVIKAVLVVLAVAVASGGGCLVVFPWLLSKGNPLRPLDAFGWTAAVTLAGSTLIVATSYWRELSLVDRESPPSLLPQYGPRFAVLAAGLLLAFIIRRQFRSKPTSDEQAATTT